jgi:hypothetical protein
MSSRQPGDEPRRRQRLASDSADAAAARAAGGFLFPADEHGAFMHMLMPALDRSTRQALRGVSKAMREQVK